MKRPKRLWSIVFLLTLAIPGYALATATFTFQSDHANVLVGQTFNVSVFLSTNNAPPPTDVHGYQYCLDYDQTLVQLVPPNIPCATSPPVDINCFAGDPTTCIAPAPVDGGFFDRNCSDNCTAQLFPSASNCCATCNVVCPLPGPGNVQFADLAGFNPGDPPECVCAKPVPFGQILVSTLTFRAIAAGPVQFSTRSDCTVVFDCDEDQTPPIVNLPLVDIHEKPPIPALSGYGTGIFALLIAGSFIFIMRKYRRSEKNVKILLVLLAFGIALGCGMCFPGFAAAGPACPDECKLPVKLDLNNDGSVNVIDVSVLSKCIKSSCSDPAMDVNGDGIVDQADYQLLVDCIKKGCSKPQ